MTEPGHPTYRVGGTITDLCRACKLARDHTVMALDASGHPARVVCDYCRSEHNFRGGDPTPSGVPPPHAHVPPPPPRLHRDEAHAPMHRGAPPPHALVPTPAPRLHHDGPHAPSGGTQSVTTSPSASDLENLLRRIVREELGLDPTAPAPKWRGGQVVLRPGKPGLQDKVLPIDALFHKVVMVRNRLRTLEQQLNGAEIPEDLKLRLQSYVTGCYGSLTSFNVLFADEADQFRGTGGE